jgi:hypothetical protein
MILMGLMEKLSLDNETGKLKNTPSAQKKNATQVEFFFRLVVR